jgi:hypothetical protein
VCIAKTRISQLSSLLTFKQTAPLAKKSAAPDEATPTVAQPKPRDTEVEAN